MDAKHSRWLFWGPTLIWASTWHVILFQLDSGVPALNSVAWRFGLAALMLAGLARARCESLAFGWRAHALMAVDGVIQYSGNYLGVYEAEARVPSGLVAVLFCLMVFGNALLARFVFKQRSSPRFLLATAGGVAGVALVFWPEIASSGARPAAGLGMAIGLGAVAAACVGNMLTLTLTRRGLPLVPVLAWCMGYGSVFLVGLAAVNGQGLHFALTPAYVGSLLYLAAAGSVLAFVLYFKLAQAQGPARAALTSVIIPVLALVVSALLEGWQPTPLAVVGMGLSLASVYVATRP
ncbi:MAG: DMT family transporter [Pelomonas sp.]|nr:DMT family transporter [Roseateles sp.]